MLALSAHGAREACQGGRRRLEGSTAGPESGPRVLIVDDDRDAADTLAALLECLRYRVESAYDGRVGLEAAIEFRPDVAILDIAMPGIDGLALARRLRARPGGESLLLIALTGWADEQSRRLSREAGFDHFLAKPAAIEALVAAIGRVAGEAGQEGPSRATAAGPEPAADRAGRSGADGSPTLPPSSWPRSTGSLPGDGPIPIGGRRGRPVPL